ncbi:hypothetical protein [Gracilibacillus kekensis]|uniref:Uncharacterized protein n=1 Tax=Gracilibacillus kekensis TaxID=1027249 RepID=A0A1M7L974_9BACI|nr:hypothetical protein [Gracilibacillus kekensis]SHM74689.1 hypothetical protein SAMN05216179_0997 [Gracilibacillus kekensis]
MKKSVSSPVFFSNENKIAFLSYTNWAKDPAKYELMTMELSSQNIETIKLDTPNPTGDKRVIKSIDMSVNAISIAALYIVLMGLLSVFCLNYYPKKTYLPSISFSIAVLTFLASLVVAATVNAWYGIGLGMLAAAILVCSIVIFLFIVIFKRFVK